MSVTSAIKIDCQQDGKCRRDEEEVKLEAHKDDDSIVACEENFDGELYFN